MGTRYGGHFLVCCLSTTDTSINISTLTNINISTLTNINSTLNNSNPSKAKACEVQSASDSELDASKSQFPTAVREREHNPFTQPGMIEVLLL